MRVFTADEVRSLVPMRDAIDAVREGFVALSSGRAEVPVRTAMSVGDNTTLTMPAYIHDSPISIIKIISVYPNNPQRGLSVVIGNVLVFDASTGVLQAIIDGAALTALRTGAASGLATELLALPNADTLAVIGAGRQARTQVEAVLAVRPIRRIRVYSPRYAEAFADELARLYPNIEVVTAPSAASALKEAPIIVAATSSPTPVIYLADVIPGAHINGVGSFKPEMQEVAADVVARAQVIVDHRESAWKEAGDLIIPRDLGLISEADVHAEIGEIAAGVKPARMSPEAITFFKSVGNAVQDAAVAERVLRAAR